MAYQEVTSLDAEVTTPIGGVNKKTGKKNPTSAEGYFLGSRKVDSKKSKTGYALIHFLQTSKGNLGVWGKTDLDRKLANVIPGTMIRITHSGMQATPNGEMYKYKVEIDNDNTIEVAATNDDAPVAQEEDSYSDSNSSFEDTEDDSYDSGAVAAAQAAQAAERKAKVQALLNKGKKV